MNDVGEQSHVKNWRELLPGRGNSKYKCPLKDTCLTCKHMWFIQRVMSVGHKLNLDN